MFFLLIWETRFVDLLNSFVFKFHHFYDFLSFFEFDFGLISEEHLKGVHVEVQELPESREICGDVFDVRLLIYKEL